MNSKWEVSVGYWIEAWGIVRASGQVVVQLIGSRTTGSLEWSFCVVVRDGTSDGWELGDLEATPFLTSKGVSTSTGFTNFPSGSCFKGATSYLQGLGLLPGGI